MAIIAQNGDYNLTTAVSIYNQTAAADGQWLLDIRAGDGTKNLNTAVGTLTLAVTIGGATLNGGAVSVAKDAAVLRAVMFTPQIFVANGDAVTVTLLSTSASDTDVDVTVTPRLLWSDLEQWGGTAPLALSSQQVQAVVPATQKVDVETIKTRAATDVGSGQTVYLGTSAWSTLTQSQVAGGAYDLTNATFVAAFKSALGTVPASGNWATVGAAMSLANGAIITATFGTCVPPAPSGMSTLTQLQVTGGAYDMTNAGCTVHLAADQEVNVTKWGGTAVASAYVQANAAKIGGQTATAAAAITVGAYLGGTGAAAVETTAQLILTDTAEIGVAGAGLTAIPWNAAWDAEVQSECADALAAYSVSTLDAAGIRAAIGMATANLDTQLANIPTGTGGNLID